jgi:transcriptional regulator with XRE-family HTH domain
VANPPRKRPLLPGHAALGRAIRDVRTAQGLSQEDAALRCGLDRSYFGFVERGERNITVAVLWRIADGLGLPASELLSREEHLIAGP